MPPPPPGIYSLNLTNSIWPRYRYKGIVARYIREGIIAERPRGGRNHVRVDAEMRDCLNDILNENLLLTLAQITASLKSMTALWQVRLRECCSE